MPSWENNVRRVVPYTPGEQPKMRNLIKLNTNENPYPPSPRVLEALRGIDEDSLRRYPDPASAALNEAIARLCGVDVECVFSGVGSDDVLAMSFLTFFASGRPVLFPDITYSFYDVWADLFRIPYETPKLDGSFRIVERDYYKENGGVVIANPNAPTGVLLGIDQIRGILEHNRHVVVIVDEAYIDFAAEEDEDAAGSGPLASAASLIREFENLLVVRTLSKSRSLAGMRIGYAIGSAKLIRYLNDVKYSFNSYTMNQAAIAAGCAAIQDEAYFRQCTAKIIRTRERVKEELRALGFCFEDSRANFLFVTHPAYQARELFAALRRENIVVRYFDKPRIDNYLRITIGTDDEMDALIRFFRRYAAAEKCERNASKT